MQDTGQIAGAQGGEAALARAFLTLLQRPLLALVLLAAVTLAAAMPLGQLRIAVDFAGLFGANTPGAQAIRDHAQRFAPLRADEVLLVRAPSLADPVLLEALETLVLDLQFVDGVERVLSLASLPAPGREGVWLTGPELADLPPEARLQTMRSQNPLAAQLLSEDLTATLIAVIPEAGQGGAGFAARLQQVAAESPLQVTNVGLMEVQRAVGDEILRDLWTLTPAAVVICLGLLLVVFRDLRALLVIGRRRLSGWCGFSGCWR